MIILGIDPALRTTGYAVLEKQGNNIIYIKSGIITTGKLEMPLAIAKIMDEISIICKAYKPQIASIETVFINKNPESSIKLVHARGGVIGILAQNNIPIQEYTPNFIKKAITGAGKADKEQMKHMINMLLPGYNFEQYDEIDAIAITYTAIIHQNLSKYIYKDA
jgi:crossover junction endodeoxyribonuclease RuvC